MTTKLETYAISHENSSNELIRETPYSAQETVNSQQLAILKKNFPSCFDKNGAFLPNKLAELVGTETEVSQEFYELNWLGRSYAKYLRNAPPEMLMTEDTEHNAEPINQDSQNLLIQGDNLEVLKHLKNAYAEQVKMIYIDPPYNTGSDGFVYQDDRKFTPQQLSELANVPIEEAERILAFTAKGSNSHSAWLTFMYPRLYVARELLKDDGVIFISIDDNEQAQLKLLCDDVFGEENFIACLPWRKRTAKSDVPFGVSQDYEWLIVYASSAEFIASIEGKERRYYETDDYPNRPWRTHDLTTQRNSMERPNSFFSLVNPKNGKEYPANPNRTWAVTVDTFPDYLQAGKIIFPEDYDFLNISTPVMRYFKDDDMEKAGDSFGKIAVSSKLPSYVGTFADAVAEHLGILGRSLPDDVGMSKEGTKEITQLFGNKVFSYPKPTALINFLVKISTKSKDLILDFFSGSGTTAHAVMQLNADDGGNRQFIAVQIAEPTDSKSEAFKAGYRTIFDITKERIIRASQKIRGENPEAKGDFGFKIYKTTPHLINHNIAFDLNQPELPELLELQPDDYLALLTTWRLYDGAKLTEKVTNIDLDGYTAHLCQQNLYLMYPNFQPKHLIQLIKQLDNDPSFTPNRVVMLGETIDSSRQNEIYQALKDYANKKSLDLSVIVRNI